mmetsp:Transcript_22557/g.74402  ORF Transcript_22557/g.74402 Transcript_22557/m.74402 type:complete len:144 (+) Transcript_22557:533-964(+)
MMILRTGAPTPQTRAGGSLAALLSLLRARPPSDSGHPNDKVVAKLCSLAAAAAVATAVQPAEPTADEPAAAPDTAAKAAAAADEAAVRVRRRQREPGRLQSRGRAGAACPTPWAAAEGAKEAAQAQTVPAVAACSRAAAEEVK